MIRGFLNLFELGGSGGGRWLPMEGLRGIAVTLVFFVHYTTGMSAYFDGKPKFLEVIHAIGNTGVDIFFVLSGFLIYRAVIRRPIDYRAYAWRRIERIYPAFLAVFALYLVIGAVLPQSSKLPETGVLHYVAVNLLLLPGMIDMEPMITVAWSLSYEAFYYIAVPLLVAGLLLRGWAPPRRIALFALVLAGFIVLAHLGEAGRFRLTMFLGGILLYEISCLRTEDRENALIDWAALAAFVVSLATFGIQTRPPNYLFLNAALVLLLWRCLYAPGPAARLFSWRPLRLLGNMSYSYYLTHSLGLQVFFMFLPAVDPPGTVLVYAALVPAGLLFSVAASVPIYLAVERPLSLRPHPESKGPATPS